MVKGIVALSYIETGMILKSQIMFKILIDYIDNPNYISYSLTSIHTLLFVSYVAVLYNKQVNLPLQLAEYAYMPICSLYFETYH